MTIDSNSPLFPFFSSKSGGFNPFIKVTSSNNPTLTSVTVNAAGTTMTFVFNMAVTDIDWTNEMGGTTGGFMYTASIGGWTVNYASGDNSNTIVCGITHGPILAADVITLDYTIATGVITNLASIPLQEIANRPTTNNSVQQ